MTAQEAYEIWNKQHTINLRVYTNEQMFELGYNMRDEEIAQLKAEIKKLSKKPKEPK
jgi:hypothetical protein